MAGYFAFERQITAILENRLGAGMLPLREELEALEDMLTVMLAAVSDEDLPRGTAARGMELARQSIILGDVIDALTNWMDGGGAPPCAPDELGAWLTVELEASRVAILETVTWAAEPA